MRHPIQIVLFQSRAFKDTDYKRQMQIHKHSSLELSYLISGELTLEFFSSETQSIEKTHIFPRQFFIIRPNCPHSVNIPSSMMSIGVEFICEDGDIVEYLKNSSYINNLPIASMVLQKFQDILIFRDNQNVAYLLNNLKKYTETTTTDVFLESSYELALKQLLIEILKCTNESHKIRGQNMYIMKAVSYIESNYMHPLNVQTIADYLGISTVYLQKMFRSNLNTSINAFINETRINKAKHLISTTNFSLKKISHDTGYNSLQIFIQNFKKLTGHTPTKYKQLEIYNDNLSLFITHNSYIEQKLD